MWVAIHVPPAPVFSAAAEEAEEEREYAMDGQAEEGGGGVEKEGEGEEVRRSASKVLPFSTPVATLTNTFSRSHPSLSLSPSSPSDEADDEGEVRAAAPCVRVDASDSKGTRADDMLPDTCDSTEEEVEQGGEGRSACGFSEATGTDWTAWLTAATSHMTADTAPRAESAAKDPVSTAAAASIPSGTVAIAAGVQTAALRNEERNKDNEELQRQQRGRGQRSLSVQSERYLGFRVCILGVSDYAD